ncbi:hypothetical protein [Leptospira tipperaryensis]|uniref:hypothetical protein n=1 Tax=Leptospira tipperaryensis TaxID=2564040 RepID=UPI0012EAD898|nr:hypothetical protein [Leptospira tipperaryensis]
MLCLQMRHSDFYRIRNVSFRAGIRKNQNDVTKRMNPKYFKERKRVVLISLDEIFTIREVT